MRYCWIMTITPRMAARMILWMNVLRIIIPSFPASTVVETPVLTFWGEIIFDMTAPLLLLAAINTGLRFNWRAATTCKLPKRAFDEVSLPLRKQAIQPRKTEKKGKIAPTFEIARPNVYDIPE